MLKPVVRKVIKKIYIADLDVCTVHFVVFYYICPTNAQYILTTYFSYSTATCLDVYTFVACLVARLYVGIRGVLRP
jgi:hypothetical protein